ncbi:hypothetical protein acdb102_45060 [Acidothermaceae bacterium B102]|nr:hypothetical protein acdb102_45060 [Acidothermaceae bacterium B102]
MTVAAAAQRTDEGLRLASLRRLGALEVPAEPVFDWLAQLAATTLHAPLAMITLVDEDRLWVRASSQPMLAHYPRAGSMCEQVVEPGGWFEVRDAEDDRRFMGGAMAAAGLHSYSGTPIYGVDGRPVGALCVLDDHPRQLSESERGQLEQIADLVTGQLHLTQWRAKALAELGGDVLAIDLRQGVAAGQIVPAYQPVVAMSDRRVVGTEALARWEHPVRGLLTPAAFLDVAQRDGQLLDIDITVMDQAVRQAGRWYRDASITTWHGVSINVGDEHLADPNLVRNISGALDTYNVPARLLTLELTETVLASAGADAVSKLTRLRELGVKLAIDDFGIAHSALSYIHKFPLTCIKIDVGFVAGIGQGLGHEKFIDSILSLARRLEMDVVAEGVETEAQAAILLGLGCPQAQGYLYAAPLSADAITSMLKG